MAAAKVFDSSLHGFGLAPEAAKPPIGLMLARRSTDAGEIFRLFTSAAKSCTALRVGGLRLKSMVMPASRWTSLSTLSRVAAEASRP